MSARTPTSKELCRMVGISEGQLQMASGILRDAIPEVVHAVERGSLHLNAAHAIAKHPKSEQAALLAKQDGQNRRKVEGMSETPLSIRVASDLVAELDALVPLVGNDPRQSTILGGTSRSSVIRLALVEGIRVLQRRYPTHD